MKRMLLILTAEKKCTEVQSVQENKYAYANILEVTVVSFGIEL